MRVSKGPPRVVVDDRYELECVVGEGAAGEVWLAHDRQLDIAVALKLLRPGLVPTDAIRSRFQQEAELSARMLSPSIVKVLARGVSDDRPYIAYEWLEGESLGAHLREVSRLPFPEVRGIVVHVCWALTRAHAVGVLHRDIKPDNVFLSVDPDGRRQVKVLDFGVAELTRHAATEIVGTLAYLAPEVLLGERPAGVRSDLYALGALAYECCTGKPPFPSESVGQLVLAHATQKVGASGVGAEVDAWFARALARDPDARFTNAKEMAESLHEATKTGDRGSRLPRPPSVVPPPPVTRERPPPAFRQEDASPRYSLVDRVEAEDLRPSRPPLKS